MNPLQEPRRILEHEASAWSELEPGLRALRGDGPSDDQLAVLRHALGLPAAQSGKLGAADVRPRVKWPWFMLTGVLLMAAGARSWLPAPGSAPARRPPPARPALVLPQRIAPPAQPGLESAPVVVPVEPTPRPARAAASPKPTERRRPPTPVAAEGGAAHDDVGSAGELALLRRAKAHARSNPARALALVVEHEQRFPQGALLQEREVIAIEALSCAGQRAVAEQRAAKFLARFPESAHGRRVRALLAEAAHASNTKAVSQPSPAQR